MWVNILRGFLLKLLEFGKAPIERSWLGSLIATFSGGLKITVSKLHIRYEDSISNPRHPFCSGVTLSKFVAVATDEQDNETFDSSGALDKLREISTYHISLQLLRQAVYHDSESAPWMFGKSWEDLNSADWTEIFQDGIDEHDGNSTASLWAKDQRYLVFPINGALKYRPLGNLERQNLFKKGTVVLSDVYFTVSKTQYCWCIKLLDALSTNKTRMEVSHLRPDVPVLEDTHAWWRYAMFASLQEKKLWCLTHAKLQSVGAMKRIWRSFIWLLGIIIICTTIVIYLGLSSLLIVCLCISDGCLHPDWC